MTAKRNANIVSLTKAEKRGAISALTNQIDLLRSEPASTNPVIQRMVAEQIDTLERVVEKLS